MKIILGLLVIILGAAFGLYVGFWLCLAGGIIDIIHQFGSGHPNVGMVGWDLFRILCSALCGWVSFLIMFVVGSAIMMD